MEEDFSAVTCPFDALVSFLLEKITEEVRAANGKITPEIRLKMRLIGNYAGSGAAVAEEKKNESSMRLLDLELIHRTHGEAVKALGEMYGYEDAGAER